MFEGRMHVRVALSRNLPAEAAGRHADQHPRQALSRPGRRSGNLREAAKWTSEAGAVLAFLIIARMFTVRMMPSLTSKRQGPSDLNKLEKRLL